MAFDFPSSPTVGQTYAPVPGILYTWNGYAWASQTSSTGMMTKIIPFAAAGNFNYVPSAGLISAIIELVAAGGGGGGVGDSTGGIYYGAGGGSGGYSRRAVTPAMIGASINVTVGAGGNGSTPTGTGGTGGQTYVGASFATAICAATGGAGGPGATSALPSTGGAGGSVTGAVGDVVVPGNPGSAAGTTTTASGVFHYGGGNGGDSFFGGAGRGSGSSGVGNSVVGGAGSVGGGGGGAHGIETTTARNGGAGGAGFVVITESIAVTAVAAPGFPVLIQRQDISSAVPNVNFVGIDATYDEYELRWFNVTISVDGPLCLRISQDNGATWKAGASDYLWGGTFLSFSSPQSAFTGAGAAAISYAQITAGIVAASTTVPSAGKLSFFAPSTTVGKKAFLSDSFYSNATGGHNSFKGFADYVGDNNAINGLRIFNINGGNITGGSFMLYGIKK